MFSCPLCAKTFSCQSKLDYHMVTHTKEKPYKCPMCPAAFGLKGTVKQHIKIVHDGIKQTRIKNHQCTMCSFKCNAKSSLQAHMRKHSAELPFSCHRPGYGCGFRTKHKSSLPQHALQAHSNKRPFKCPSDGCSFKAKSRAVIKEHVRVHSIDKPFVCTISGCNCTFKSKQALKRHCSTVHSNEKPYKCSVCDFRTKYGDNLRVHQIRHTKVKRFQCEAPKCGFASYHRNDLKVHFDRKHRKLEILCTEPRCDFRCGSNALLKTHLKIHKLPILRCPDDSCDFSTIYINSLHGHISSRHKDFQSSVTVVGTRLSYLKTAGTMSTLRCSFTDCNYETRVPHHYDRHKGTHKKGQHVCSFCCSSFSSLSWLRAHVKRHTGEKPYSCSLCSYTTVDSCELKNHARKHHQIHILIPRGKDNQFKKCCTCGRNCFSNGETVLHSMSHLQPVVVLQKLMLHVL